MTHKEMRMIIRSTISPETNRRVLQDLGIDVMSNGFFRVRPDDKTPSCKINKDGSFYDFGSGEHYSDIVSLFFDGYHAFDSVSETMQWTCQILGIQWEVANG